MTVGPLGGDEVRSSPEGSPTVEPVFLRDEEETGTHSLSALCRHSEEAAVCWPVSSSEPWPHGPGGPWAPPLQVLPVEVSHIPG